jgi:hypothetical protein
MRNTNAGNYVCPFMSGPIKVPGVETKYDYMTLMEVKCYGPKCMAWAVGDEDNGSCNLAFPGESEFVGLQ